MEYRTLGALAAVLASVPAAISAQPAPDGVPVLPLRPPPGADRTMPPAAPAHWQAPPRPRGWVWGQPGWWGGSYQPAIRGYILPSYWLSPAYVIPDPAAYGFADSGWGRRWIRYYDDAVLVDERGLIHDSVHGVAWDRHGQSAVPAYAGARDAGRAYGADYDHGHDDEVTWQGGSARSDRQIWAWPAKSSADGQGNVVIMVPAGSSATITFQPQPVVTTTTTTTYYEDEAPRAAPVYNAPVYKEYPRTKEQPRSTTPPRVIGRVPVNKG